MINWPAAARGDFQEFLPIAAVGGASDARLTWLKPQGVQMVYILCIGAGGSGGGGLTGAAGTARGGGGGGGSGAVSRLLIPAMLLPDVLSVIPGTGGASAAAGGAGNTGIASYVILASGTNAPGYIISAAGGLGGIAGTAAGSNAGGAAAAILSLATAAIGNLGLLVSIAGSAGSASGAIAGAVGAAGVALLWNNGTGPPICGGAGGGTVGTNNANFAGGDITASGIGPLGGYPTIPGGLAAGGAGNPGMLLTKPWRSGGGSGGGTNGAAGVGGRGGNGNIGSGGGGGGGGVTGGASGRGGNGYVAFWSW